MSMDDAFDDPEFVPFSLDKSKRRVQQQKRSDEGELVESKEMTESKVPESIVSEEAPVIQMSELDEEYEQARSSEVVNDELFNDLLGDSKSSNEDEGPLSSRLSIIVLCCSILAKHSLRKRNSNSRG